MNDEPDASELEWRLRGAFGDIQPTRDLASAARRSGERLRRRRRRRALRWAPTSTAAVLVLTLLASTRWNDGGGEVGGVPMWLGWLVATMALALTELLLTGFVLLMLAGGALVAAALAGLGGPPTAQVVAFAITSVALLAVVRPVATGRLARSTPQHQTGVQALVGLEAVVTRAVDVNGGRVSVGGEEWSAEPLDATQVFPVGSTVVVMEIRGATAMVWRLP